MNPSNPFPILGHFPSPEAFFENYRKNREWIKSHILTTEELPRAITDAKSFAPFPQTFTQLHRHIQLCWGQVSEEELKPLL